MTQDLLLVVYIAGPYRAPTREGVLANIEQARQAFGELLRRGYAAICPHTMTALGEEHWPDLSPEVYLVADLELLDRCDLLLVLPGWETSEGTKGEIARARELNIPIYWSLEELKPRGQYA